MIVKREKKKNRPQKIPMRELLTYTCGENSQVSGKGELGVLPEKDSGKVDIWTIKCSLGN